MRIVPQRLRSTGTALFFSDFCALLVSLFLAYCLRAFADSHLPIGSYIALAPAFGVFLLLYAALGLYPGILLQPSEELKRLSLGSSISFLFLSFALFLGQQGILYSRAVVLLSWLLALAAVPIFRCLTRNLCARKSWWGYPVLLFIPPGENADSLRELFVHRGSALYVAEHIPISLEANPDSGKARAFEKSLEEFKAAYPGALACILAGSLSHDAVQMLVLQLSRYFRRVAVKFDTPWLTQSSLRVVDFPCGPVLTMRHNLLDPVRVRLKRVLDLCFCLIGAGFFVCLIPLIACAIRLESKGPVFFKSKRIGLGGKAIYVLKFRSMVADAADILKAKFEEDPDLRREWTANIKLADDPRVTKVGAFLRRTSLDELPQIWNVLKGDMSLVGPRPILEEEIARYGSAYELYKRVRPGITGLWQVSGRNEVNYTRRLELVQQYIYNWSVWLDIYIICRTIPALFSGRGAY